MLGVIVSINLLLLVFGCLFWKCVKTFWDNMDDLFKVSWIQGLLGFRFKFLANYFCFIELLKKE